MNSDNLTSVLKNLHTLSPYIIGSGILTKEGMILESSLIKEQDEDVVAASGAALSDIAGQIALRIFRGNAEAAIVKSDNGFIIVAPCEGKLILAVIVTLDAVLNDMIQIVECTAEVIGQRNFELAA